MSDVSALTVPKLAEIVEIAVNFAIEGNENDQAYTALAELVRRANQSDHQPDPWPVIKWLEENYPAALELCPYRAEAALYGLSARETE